METYLFRLKHYNIHDDRTYEFFGTIGAESYGEAMSRIDKRFRNIETVFLRQTWFNDGFTFLNPDEWRRLMDEEDMDEDERESKEETP